MARCYSCLVLTLLGLGYVLLMLLLCYKLPFSQLYSTLHDYDLLYERVESLATENVREATIYFKNLDAQSSKALYRERLQSGNTQFAIGIITVKRKNKKAPQSKSPNYLLHTMALMDKAMKESEYLHSSLPFICNVELEPHNHTDAVDLYTYLPYTERYGNNSLNVPPLTFPKTETTFKSWTKHTSKYNKETFDYAFCLLTAAYLKPKFVILIEDDTIPHKDFPTILEHMIESRLKNHPKFAYLKLYFPPKWQGFAAELPTLFDLVLWGFVMSCFICVCLLLLNKCSFSLGFGRFKIFSKHYYSLPCNLRISANFKSFLFLYLICLLSIWLLGRQNVEAFRRFWRYSYRLQKADGCCTQAQMYPIEFVEALSEYLLSVSVSAHTDLAITDFAAEQSLPTWQVEPNLFFHNGLITSLNGKQKHPEEFMFKQ